MESEKNIPAQNISPLAPIVPFGKSIGNETMIFALSNDILKALPFDEISAGAQSLFEYLSTYAAEEIRKAVKAGTYDYTDTEIKRFSLNIKNYIDMCLAAGKKHYTYEEIDLHAKELVKIPLSFMENDGRISVNTVLFSTIKIDSETGECSFEITSAFLSHWAPELSLKKEQHLLSLMESFKFNGYQNTLYRLINGQMQTVSSEYSVPINILKTRMGVKEGTRIWDNGRFCERILSPTCEEIIKRSDISFSYRIERYSKSRRIKNIIFYDFRRKGVENLKDNDIIDVPYTDATICADTTNTNDLNLVKIELNEDEKILARIFSSCRQRGFSGDETFFIYELYRLDFDRFQDKVIRFDSMVKEGILNNDGKMKFFMNKDL